MVKKRIFLSPPHMGQTERELLIDAFDSNWIAPIGPHVDAFEREMAGYLDIPHAAALSSGTAALHLALKIIGIKQNNIILCPSLTFSATANVIKYEKAIPVFLDVDPETWTIDPKILELAIKKYKPKALIAVDLYGQSADYDIIGEICVKNNVVIIEDAAEALGSEYKDQKCGTFGIVGIISFNGNKIITTSSGGMLVSNKKNVVNKARFLSTQARESQIHYEHKELGYNYRMSNLLAAIGRGQLRTLDQRVKTRRRIFARYFNTLSKNDGSSFMQEAPYGKTNRWLTTLTIDPQITGVNRTQIINALEQENIEARPVWKPMHMQPFYKGCNYMTLDQEDVSLMLFENGLCLPSGSNLTNEDQSRIIDIIYSTVKSD